jgi:hypothetical protein
VVRTECWADWPEVGFLGKNLENQGKHHEVDRGLVFKDEGRYCRHSKLTDTGSVIQRYPGVLNV